MVRLAPPSPSKRRIVDADEQDDTDSCNTWEPTIRSKRT